MDIVIPSSTPLSVPYLKLSTIVRMQDIRSTFIAEYVYRVVGYLLSSLRLKKSEAHKLGQVILVVQNEPILSVSLTLQVNQVNLQYIISANICLFTENISLFTEILKRSYTSDISTTQIIIHTWHLEFMLLERIGLTTTDFRTMDFFS